jgi:hypothetical protein
MRVSHVRLLSIPAAAVVAWALMGASSCANTGGSAAGGGNAVSSDSSGGGVSAAVALGTAMKSKDGKSVTVTKFTPNFSTGNEFETPDPGKECVQVTLALSNGSSSEWSLPLSEIGVVDSTGQKYSAFGSMNCGSGDNIDSIVAGGHANASLTFQVPANSPLNLTWVPNSLEDQVYQAKLR